MKIEDIKKLCIKKLNEVTALSTSVKDVIIADYGLYDNGNIQYINFHIVDSDTGATVNYGINWDRDEIIVGLYDNIYVGGILKHNGKYY